MQLTEEKKIAVLKRVFEDDIEQFGKFFFSHHLKLGTPAFHKEIYGMYEGEWDKIAIAAPRGHAKSTITDLIYLAWVVCNKKAKFTLLVSDTYSQSTLFLEALKAELEGNERLRMFYGNLTTDKWSEGEIVTNDCMIKALGAGMKVRGLKFRESRPDLILVDDLENDELVENKERREKLERWFNGALVPCMGKGGRIIVIGTILHYDSLLYKLTKNEAYTEFHKKTYKAINDNGVLWEEHLNRAELEKIKSEYIANGQGYLFYQEYQNDPVSDENRKFKIEKMQHWSEEQIKGKMLNVFISIDRAYSTDKTADFTGIVINRVDDQNNWYIAAERFKGDEKQLIDKIFDLKSYYNPLKIAIEQNAFEFTLKPHLEDEMRRRNVFFSIEELKTGGASKIHRIEGLVPRFEAKTIYLRKEDIDLVDELIRFPMGEHDDLCDALSYQLQIAEVPAKTYENYNLYNNSFA